MTREEAQELLATTDGKLVMEKLQAVNFIFNELDELKMMEEDAQQYALKCRKELEALQQPKRCNTCRFYHSFTGVCANDNCPLCADFVDADFGCIYHEPKEQ